MTLQIYDRRTNELIRNESSHFLIHWLMRAEHCDERTARVIARGLPKGHIIASTARVYAAIG